MAKKKTGPLRARFAVCRRGGRQSPSRGEQLTACRLLSGRMGNRLPPVVRSMQRQFPQTTQRVACQPCGSDSRLRKSDAAVICVRGLWLEMPTLRFRDQEVAEYLHACDRLQFFRIDEIGVERDGIGVP